MDAIGSLITVGAVIGAIAIFVMAVVLVLVFMSVRMERRIKRPDLDLSVSPCPAERPPSWS